MISDLMLWRTRCVSLPHSLLPTAYRPLFLCDCSANINAKRCDLRYFGKRPRAITESLTAGCYSYYSASCRLAKIERWTTAINLPMATTFLSMVRLQNLYAPPLYPLRPPDEGCWAFPGKLYSEMIYASGAFRRHQPSVIDRKLTFSDYHFHTSSFDIFFSFQWTLQWRFTYRPLWK